MITFKLNVEENTLKEAESILSFVGMDLQTAVNLFLRRIVIERGLPLSMTAAQHFQSDGDSSNSNQRHLIEDGQTRHGRKQNVITREMVDEVWQAFTKHLKGLGEIRELSVEVANSSGMNRGSAFIYLNILLKLVKGETHTRVLKMDDLEYFMGKIKTELGEVEFRNALRSLNQSIPYWREKVPGLFADKVEDFCNKHQVDMG